MITLNIDEDKLGALCICALRYCQGRRTYMPDLVRSIVRPILPKLSDRTIQVMAADCKFQKELELYGDEIADKPGWQKWELEVEEEKERRKIYS